MDLLPGYREIRPPEEVRDIVACIWVRVTDADGDVRVIPDGCADVVWQRGTGVTVAGPDLSGKLIPRTRDDVLVGMRLRPGAGGRVLGTPLDELRDLRVEVADVDRTFQLDGELEPDEVVRRFVAAAAGRKPDPLVAEATRRLASQSIAAVARDLWVSERQLRRRFHAEVGYGPKTLARVLRFQRFVAAVDAGRADLARMALDAGYADQAHLTREAAGLSGLPPQAFMRARNARVAV